MADGTITIGTEVDSSGISKGVKGLSSVISKGASLAKAGFSAVTTGVTKLGTSIVNLSVIGGKYDGEIQQTSFLLNRMADSTQELINTNANNAKSLGMTSKQYKDCSASVGTFMKSMGMSTKEIDNMLPKIVELTANGSAFANVPIEDALNAITSASMGNYEALGSLNIEMSDALINQSSYAKSLGKTTQDMTMAEKTQAIYNTMLERGGHLSGFAESESDSFSTSLNTLKTKVFETGGALGQILLPVLQPVIDKVIALADKIKYGAEKFKEVYEKTGDWKTALMETLKELKLDNIISFIEKIVEFKDKVVNLIEQVKLIPEKIKEWEQPLTVAAIALGTLATAIIAYNIQQNWFAITNAIGCAALYAWDAACAIATATTGALATVVGFLTSPITLTILAIGALIAIGYLLIKNWDSISEFLGSVWDYICNLAEELFNGLCEWLSGIWEDVKQGVEDAWNSILEFLGGLGEWFYNIMVSVKEAVAEGWNSIVEFFTETVPQLVSNIIEWFGELPYMIGYLIGQILGFFIMLGMNIWTWITEELPLIIEGIVAWFISLPEKIWTWLLGVINYVVEWGSQMYNQAITWISQFVNGCIEWISELPGRIWQWLLSVINKVIEWGGQMYNQAITWISEFVSGCVEWISKLPGRIWQWLMSTINKVIEFGSNLANKAVEIGSNFVTWLIDEVKSLPDKFLELGGNIVKGIWNGILGAKDWLLGKVGDFFDGVIDGAKDFLGIHSPSRVFRDQVGVFMAQGVGVGFDKEANNMEKDIKNRLSHLVERMQSSVMIESDIASRRLTSGRYYGSNEVITNNNGVTQNITFNNPVESPYETYKAIRKAGRDLAFG